MPRGDSGTTRYQRRDDLLPGAVASGVAYESRGMQAGSHRGLPSP